MGDQVPISNPLSQCRERIVTLEAEMSQLQQDYADLQAERDRIAATVRANEALKRSLNQLAGDRQLDAFLGYVVREALQLLEGACAQVFLFDANSNTMTSSIGVDREGNVLAAPGLTQGTPMEQPFPANITKAWERVINHRGPLYFDIEQDAADFFEGAIEYHRQQGHHGSIGIALTLGDQPLGVLGLALQERTEFSASEFEFFQALAQQATLAIHLTQLSEEVKQAAILKERNRIARDLHDSLAQSLTGVLIQLSVATQFLDAEPEETKASLIRAENLARQGLTEARRSVWLLYDDAATTDNLPSSLNHVVEQMTCNAPAHITLSVEGTPYSLGTAIDLNLLRIAQESLTNALRHAQAQIIQLQLVYTAQQIQLQISDDGCGFELQESKRGFGLLGMRDRAKEIDAALQIDSTTGNGTTIKVTIMHE